MTRKFFGVFTSVMFMMTALGIVALIWFPQEHTVAPAGKQQRQTKVITPQNRVPERIIPEALEPEPLAYETQITAKIALNEGEILVGLLTDNFDEDPEEEQIIAYRNLTEKEGPIYITYINFDKTLQEYQRLWTSPTSATRPGTLSLYTQDLIGDRNPCVILSGMNNAGEATLTIFRKDPSEGNHFPFNKIADLQINGTIAIHEIQRTQAYQQGYAKGQSFSLVARLRDAGFPNSLDQQEITYTFNEAKGVYEQNSITQIPGKQIEQDRLQELLSSPQAFERFIEGLWYYVSPQGTLDTRQYLYFDPQHRELIFYGDESQQVFTWQHSSPTRYGLYIASQNISVTNLRRSLDIELESLESLRVRVSEDVRLRIGVNASWDGSYRRAAILGKPKTAASLSSAIEGLYNGSIGTMQFSPNGVYMLSSEGKNQGGKYAFFLLNDQVMVEFRPEKGTFTPSGSKREVYQVDYTLKTGEAIPENITLFPVRVGTQGIQKTHKPAIFLAAYNPSEGVIPPIVQEETGYPQEDLPIPVLSFASHPEYFSPDGDGVDDELTIFLGTQSVLPIISWSFEIREPQPPYQVFYRLEGKGKPTDRIIWNGRSHRGELVQAATDYPFIFKAEDSQGGIGTLEGNIGVDVLVIREGAGLRIQVPSIIFRAGYADFVGLPKETVDNNNRVLRRIAEILNKFRDYKVVVEGHANRTKSLAAEAELEERIELQPLSESRARTVVNYLAEFGVNRARLTAMGLGSTKPVVKFDERNDWWKNRRVEFILIK